MKTSSARSTPPLIGGGTRLGCVHGPIVWTNTTLPAKAPASRRSGVAPSSGTVPVQAARTSVATGGVHSGVTGVKRARGQRTASNTGCQSISADRRRGSRRPLRRHGAEVEERALRVDVDVGHADHPQRRIGRRHLRPLGDRHQEPRAGAVPEPDGRRASRGELIPARRRRLPPGPPQVCAVVAQLADAIGRRLAVAEAIEHLARPVFEHRRRQVDRHEAVERRRLPQRDQRAEADEGERQQRQRRSGATPARPGRPRRPSPATASRRRPGPRPADRRRAARPRPPARSPAAARDPAPGSAG